jgi:hypothetical protein
MEPRNLRPRRLTLFDYEDDDDDDNDNQNLNLSDTHSDDAEYLPSATTDFEFRSSWKRSRCTLQRSSVSVRHSRNSTRNFSLNTSKFSLHETSQLSNDISEDQPITLDLIQRLEKGSFSFKIQTLILTRRHIHN